MPYFLFEAHYGNDNNNWIDDCIIEAETLEDAFSKIGDHLEKRAKEEGIDLDIDGDDTSLTSMYWEYYNEDGEKLERDEDIDENNPGITYHFNFYFQEEYETEEQARKNKSSFHGTYSF